MNHSMPGLPVHHQLLEFTQTHIHRVSDAIQPSHPMSSPSPPAPNPSQHQSLFQWVALWITCPKYWSLGFSNSPSNEYSGLISFETDWFDLLAVQGTLKSLLWHHNLKALILWLCLLCGPALTSKHEYFVDKVMSLLCTFFYWLLHGHHLCNNAVKWIDWSCYTRSTHWLLLINLFTGWFVKVLFLISLSKKWPQVTRREELSWFHPFKI